MLRSLADHYDFDIETLGISYRHCINRKFCLVAKMKKLPLIMKMIAALYFGGNIVLKGLYPIWNVAIEIPRATRLERILANIWLPLNVLIAMALEIV